MTASSSTSRVTIQLNLTGQAASVRGVQQMSAALKDLQTVATDANTQLAASSEAAAAKIDASNQSIADSAEASAAKVVAATDEVKASQTALADTTEESSARVRAASASASNGLIGLMGSVKTLAAGAVTYSGIKAFVSYSTSLTQLSTLAGLTQKQVAALNGEIMNTAVALRQSPTALAQAAYAPASERFGVAGIGQVMRYSANLANLSNAPIAGGTGSTSYAISTMIQALGLRPTQANIARVTGLIYGTVSAGDMQVGDLTNALSSGILDTGKTYGIDPAGTLGALAFFSSMGVGPQEAATRMRMTESLLVGNTAQAAKYESALGLTATPSADSSLVAQMTGLGLSPTKMAAVLRTGPAGLNSAFQMINQAISGLPQDQQEAIWSKLFGGGRTDATAMQLAQGAANGLLTQKTGIVLGMDSQSAINQAVQQYDKSPAGQLAAFHTEWQKVEVSLGQTLMPILQDLMAILGPMLGFLAQHKVLLGAIATLIGGELALKLLGLVKNLKLVASAGRAINDIKFFSGVETEAGQATTAVGKLIQALLKARGITVGGAGGAEGASAAGAAGLGGAATAGGVLALPAAALGATLWLQTQKNPNAQSALFGAGPSLTPQAKVQSASAAAVAKALGPGGFSLTPAQVAQLQALGTPGHAQGGVTDGPMAIVGEGSRLWPEYVIPTDPAYRARALALFQSLGGHLLPGMNPAFLLAMGGGSKAKSPAGLGASTAATGSNAQIGQRMAAALGWTGNEWGALNALWTQESGWNNLAKNPSSGAYGIAQALPATKYPLAGQAAGGSSAAAQIAWGLSYIKQRYGDPLGAEAHEKNFGWYKTGGVLPFASYDSGGYLPEGISIAHNGTGAPEPVGHGLAGGDLEVKVVLDSKIVGQATIKDFRRRAARR